MNLELKLADHCPPNASVAPLQLDDTSIIPSRLIFRIFTHPYRASLRELHSLRRVLRAPGKDMSEEGLQYWRAAADETSVDFDDAGWN